MNVLRLGCQLHPLKEWGQSVGITLLTNQPGNPQQNVYMERYNKKVELDCHKAKRLTSLSNNLCKYSK